MPPEKSCHCQHPGPMHSSLGRRSLSDQGTASSILSPLLYYISFVCSWRFFISHISLFNKKMGNLFPRAPQKQLHKLDSLWLTWHLRKTKTRDFHLVQLAGVWWLSGKMSKLCSNHFELQWSLSGKKEDIFKTVRCGLWRAYRVSWELKDWEVACLQKPRQTFLAH